MRTPVKHILFWTPRVLCLLFAAFISLFALDVFDDHHGFWQTSLALLMHLIPTFIVLAVLAVTWCWEWIGAILLPALGAFHLVTMWGRFPWSTYVLIDGPLLLLGVLFLINWRQRKAQPAN